MPGSVCIHDARCSGIDSSPGIDDASVEMPRRARRPELVCANRDANFPPRPGPPRADRRADLLQNGAGMSEKRMQSYSAPGIEVTFDPGVCIHSAVCLKALPAVFDVRRSRWVRPEAATVAEVVAAIDRCPSGALQYVLAPPPPAPGTADSGTAATVLQTSSKASVIARIWHGVTPAARADEYLEFLEERALPDYRSVPGNLAAFVLRRVEGEVAHFLTVTHWESYEAIRAFAGAEIERARYYPEDSGFLLEFEPTVQHFELFA